MEIKMNLLLKEDVGHEHGYDIADDIAEQMSFEKKYNFCGAFYVPQGEHGYIVLWLDEPRDKEEEIIDEVVLQMALNEELQIKGFNIQQSEGGN